MRNTAIAFFVACLLVVMSGPAHADLITSASDPALDGSTVIDFDDLEYMWSYDSILVGDVTWTDLDEDNIWEYTRMVVGDTGDTSWGMSGYRMFARSGEFAIEFASPVSAFGMNYGGKSSTWYVYDEDDVLLETLSISQAPLAATQPHPTYFVGVSGERIQRVVCILNDLDPLSQASVVMDNFEYVLAPANVPPIADAGADQGLFVDDDADLDGSDSSDPDGDTITSYSWAIESAPATSTAGLTSANTATPGFTPDVVGEYVLSLVVSDGTVWSLPDDVTLTVAQNLPPVAVAEASPTSGDASLTVSFDASDSYDPEGEDITYAWDPGDGSSTSTSVSPTHTYTVAGDYVATLTVTDDRDQEATAHVLIQVTQANRPPTAAPTGAPATGYAPLTVTFTSNAVDLDDDDLTFAWDFDDSSSSTAANPSHTFSTAGTYDVELTVSDGTDSVTEYVAVVVAPGAELICESVRVKWRTHWGKSKGKEKGTADVRIDAYLYLPGTTPADTDVVTVYVDGTELVSVAFGDFSEEDWGYAYHAKDVMVHLDLEGDAVKVFRRKVVMTDFDPSNGAEVVVQVGAKTDVETVPLDVRGNGSLLVYDGR